MTVNQVQSLAYFPWTPFCTSDKNGVLIYIRKKTFVLSLQMGSVTILLFICFLKFYSFKSFSLHLQSQTLTKNNKDTTNYQILLPTLTLHGRISKSSYAWLWPLGTCHDCPPCLVGNKIFGKVCDMDSKATNRHMGITKQKNHRHLYPCPPPSCTFPLPTQI